ncbi:maltose acetyltransferase [Streptococcus ictaluri 707-05]|uniref:Acetyltransferase n=1 Tax=Streptococcus ictaluri 707-05 TaxID=764299 RepID=G5K365_9STRE|nr:maltose acetyltransferase [Streptococcus ictaluri 707-05]
MTELEKMLAGHLYDASDPVLRQEREVARKQMANFNRELEPKKRSSILKEWLGQTGQDIYMEPHFVCDYGSNIYLGENFYANFNTTMLDVCEIHIGKNAMIGPNCQFLYL